MTALPPVEALYYPHMRVIRPATMQPQPHAAAWLRTQLLYFDRIRTISPWHLPDLPMDRDEAELEERRLIYRQAPSQVRGAVERASRFMAMLLVMSRRGGIRSHFGHSPLYGSTSNEALRMLRRIGDRDQGHSIRRLTPHIRELETELNEVLADRYVRMHPEKMVGSLQRFLCGDSGVGVAEAQTPWIEVDPVFASVYMTILAREISVELGFSGVTDEPVHDALYQDITATMEFDQSLANRRTEGVLVDVVLSSVSLGGETPISRILAFKERHDEDLKRFRAKIYGLAAQCAQAGTLAEIKQQAADIQKRQIDPEIDQLEKSLAGAGIPFTRSGFIKATSFIMGVGAGVPSIDFTRPYFGALSATLSIGLVAFALSGWGDRQAVREASPYSYLMNVRREFGHNPA